MLASYRHFRMLRPMLCATLAACSIASNAAISVGEDFGDGSPYANNGEFFLLLSDPISEAVYLLDMGLTTNELLVSGRSDAGFQRFWTLNPAEDAALAGLLGRGTAPTSLTWSVYGIAQPSFYGQSGVGFLYTTLQHDTPTGVLNPSYTVLTAATDLALEQQLISVGGQSGYVGVLSSQTVSGPTNTLNSTGSQDFAHNGAALFLKGQPGYSAPDQAYKLPWLENLGTSSSNPVGRSSWAYMVTFGGVFDPTAAVAVDEFDNTEHDAYWGLAQDPDTGILYLSFTLEAAGMSAAQRAFTAGIGRTEFDGSFAVRALPGIAVASALERPTGYARAIGSAAVLPAVALPPVPEPATWGLMALGLLATGAAARRRRG